MHGVGDGDNQEVSSESCPFTNSQDLIDAQQGVGAEDRFASRTAHKTASKKSKRKPEISIFVDETAEQYKPPKKKSRLDGRVPLSVRSDSANSTPMPSPNPVAVLYPIPDDDPIRLNIQNFDTHNTPSPIPVLPTASPDVPVTTGNGNPPPVEDPEAFACTSASARADVDLVLPHNMVLYWLLNLYDWHVSTLDILFAYRRVVLIHHPDKVPDWKRDEATEHMQLINGAKEVLMDPQRRKEYHENGRLPWNVQHLDGDID